jgi:ATP-dependent Lon protease
MNDKKINSKIKYNLVDSDATEENKVLLPEELGSCEKSNTYNNDFNLYEFYVNKLEFYRNVVSNIIIDINTKINYKYMTLTESIKCIDETRKISEYIYDCYLFLNSSELKSKPFKEQNNYLRDNLNRIQMINDMLNKIIKLYGCYSLDDLIIICFGNDYLSSLKNEPMFSKHILLNKYFHPTSFKCLNWKTDNKAKYLIKNKIIEDYHIVESASTFECFDLARTSVEFEKKISGLKIAYQNHLIKKTLIISGYIDTCVDLKCVNNPYINNLLNSAYKSQSQDINVEDETYINYINSLTLKECLIYNINELYKNYIGIVNQYELTKSKHMGQIVNEFMNMELTSQYKFIKNLIIHSHNPSSYYLCGLLFDLLNNDNDGEISFSAQNKIYYYLPHDCRTKLKTIRSSNSERTSVYKKFNIKKIPYEQQIEMIIKDDEIKEKAYSKLKEVMTKSEESGTKARIYLEGLLKIPFGVYKEEPILRSKKTLLDIYENMRKKLLIFYSYANSKNISKDKLAKLKVINKIIESKDNNSVSFDMIQYIYNNFEDDILLLLRELLIVKCVKLSRFEVKKKIDEYNLFVKSVKLKNKNMLKELKKVTTTGKKKNEMMQSFLEVFELNMTLVINLFNNFHNTKQNNKQSIRLDDNMEENNIQNNNDEIIQNLENSESKNNDIYEITKKMTNILNEDENFVSSIYEICNIHIQLKNVFKNINVSRKKTLNVIDECIYGHNNAKKQIKNIINQWITGENSGYCFGFEGPPGIGKTSMAKYGLSKCLQDEDGGYRPFDFIALGGSSNGSYLSGHSYTYLGSSWGRIVEIIMKKKCLNPIIFIDELDKVSNSEHGKEIIGILTHLVDSSQNTMFQDKYFSGVNIDLSKALFVFSYNDPSLIDPILLDRIHRIKFDKLTPYDKLVISNKFLVPEMNEKFGFSRDFIKLDDKTLLFLIDNYTYESGVRKLKQLLFEIWGDINEILLNGEIQENEYHVTEDLIENFFLNERNKILRTKIPLEPKVGIINGLWANALGLGGLTPIQIKWFPCKTPLELKLTGMQGDIMKESMNVAKTIAWNMLTKDELAVLWNHVYSENGPCYGIHIHCPEGAVNKDGPSAGGAITTCILSMFKNEKINNKFAMTGEINLSGNITAIGGLEQKLYYGICAGAKVFAFPEENMKDFELFREKYAKKITNFSSIRFYSVKNIRDVCKLVFN